MLDEIAERISWNLAAKTNWLFNHSGYPSCSQAVREFYFGIRD